MDAWRRLVALSPPYRHPARVVLARGGECGRLGREKPRDAARGCARTSIKAVSSRAARVQLGSSRPLWLCRGRCRRRLPQRRSSAELRVVRASPATRAGACTKRARHARSAASGRSRQFCDLRPGASVPPPGSRRARTRAGHWLSKLIPNNRQIECLNTALLTVVLRCRGWSPAARAPRHSARRGRGRGHRRAQRRPRAAPERGAPPARVVSRTPVSRRGPASPRCPGHRVRSARDGAPPRTPGGVIVIGSTCSTTRGPART